MCRTEPEAKYIEFIGKNHTGLNTDTFPVLYIPCIKSLLEVIEAFGQVFLDSKPDLMMW